LVLLKLNNQKITLESVNSEINQYFGKDTIRKMNENMLEKRVFLKKYKEIYNKTLNKIMDGIKNE